MMKGTIFAACVLAACLPLPNSANAQKSKDTLRFAVQDVYKSLDPYLFPSNEAGFSRRRVFDPLLQYDESKGEFLPLIAKSWKRINDTTLEFELFDDIVFHSGNKLGVDDVIYSLEFAADPKVQIPFKNRFTWIKSIDKLGPYRLRVEAKELYNQDLMHFANRSHILDSKLHASAADPNDINRPLSGTGSYKVAKFDRNTGVTFERFDGVKKHPFTRAPIKTVEALFVPDRQTQIAQLLAGNLDLVPNVQPDNAEALAADPRFATTAVNTGMYVYWGLDVLARSGQKELQDPRVRKALFMAIDRDAIVQGVIPGGKTAARRLDAMCAEYQLGCDHSLTPPKYDPAAAKKLLAEAGYPGGFDLRVDTHVTMRDVGVAVAGYLRAIGVRANANPILHAVWLKSRTTGDMPSIVMYLPAGTWLDADYLLDTLFGSPSVDFVKDPVILENMKAGNATRDVAERKRVYKTAFDRMVEMDAYLPIGTVPALFSHTRELHIEPNPVNALNLTMSDILWN
jgi:peptide/nickel transport system substrate-binding protein